MAELRLQSGPAFDISEFGPLLDEYYPQGCPICQTKNWNVWQDNTGLVTSIPWSKQDGDIMLGRGVPFLTFSCSNCGFVRQHHVDTFRTFIEKLKNEH